MNFKTDARIWGLIGFCFGAVIASVGSISNPIDSLLGGLIQATIWYFVARFFIKRRKQIIKVESASESVATNQKKTIFLFDKPVNRDWLFYLFLFFLFANIVNALTNVLNSGGISTSAGGIISGSIDAAFRIILAYFPLIPIIYLIRKLFRNYKKRKA